MTRTYRWAEGSRQSASLAEPFGKIVEKAQTPTGTIKAARIVALAKNPKTPVHRMFEWNNAKAGHAYRCEQARAFIRALVVVTENGESNEMPVALSLGTGHDYVETSVMLGDVDLRAHMVARALSEAQSFMRRYEHLKELSAIFKAIRKVAKVSEEKAGARSG